MSLSILAGSMLLPDNTYSLALVFSYLHLYYRYYIIQLLQMLYKILNIFVTITGHEFQREHRSAFLRNNVRRDLSRFV